MAVKSATAANHTPGRQLVRLSLWRLSISDPDWCERPKLPRQVLAPPTNNQKMCKIGTCKIGTWRIVQDIIVWLLTVAALLHALAAIVLTLLGTPVHALGWLCWTLASHESWEGTTLLDTAFLWHDHSFVLFWNPGLQQQFRVGCMLCANWTIALSRSQCSEGRLGMPWWYCWLLDHQGSQRLQMYWPCVFALPLSWFYCSPVLLEQW